MSELIKHKPFNLPIATITYKNTEYVDIDTLRVLLTDYVPISKLEELMANCNDKTNPFALEDDLQTLINEVKKQCIGY